MGSAERSGSGAAEEARQVHSSLGAPRSSNSLDLLARGAFRTRLAGGADAGDRGPRGGRPGDAVQLGAPVVVLEAMKMQHTVVAPADGTVPASA